MNKYPLIVTKQYLQILKINFIFEMYLNNFL